MQNNYEKQKEVLQIGEVVIRNGIVYPSEGVDAVAIFRGNEILPKDIAQIYEKIYEPFVERKISDFLYAHIYADIIIGNRSSRKFYEGIKKDFYNLYGEKFAETYFAEPYYDKWDKIAKAKISELDWFAHRIFNADPAEWSLSYDDFIQFHELVKTVVTLYSKSEFRMKLKASYSKVIIARTKEAFDM